MYLKPKTLDEAVSLLASTGGRILAGGTDFYPACGERPPRGPVVDISGCGEIRGISVEPEVIRIGGLTTWTNLVRASLPRCLDALKSAAREIGSVQIQNRGTLAGNLCNASPAADGVPPLLAIDAVVELVSVSGRRRLPLCEFVLGNCRTARREDEILAAVLVPRRIEDAPSAFLKLGLRRSLAISIAMVAAVVQADEAGRICEARIAVGSCSEVARRMRALEEELLGRPARPWAGASAFVKPEHLESLTPIDDARATARFRRDAVLVLVRRAIEACLGGRLRSSPASPTTGTNGPKRLPSEVAGAERPEWNCERAGTAPISFQVNGRKVELEVDGMRRLSRVLREDLGLTGTKVGCDAGDCGACTVLLDGGPVCSCMVPADQVDGCEVTTVEGLARRSPVEGRLQRSFLDHGAVQCGACTPGMLVAATALLERNPFPTEEEVIDSIGGVLCRCTGYRKIVEAVVDAGRDRPRRSTPAAGKAVGQRLPRVDGPGKVDGSALFGADEVPAGALGLKLVRSPYHRARFRFGDLERFVAAHPGVERILTASDVPGVDCHGVLPKYADHRSSPATRRVSAARPWPRWSASPASSSFSTSKASRFAGRSWRRSCRSRRRTPQMPRGSTPTARGAFSRASASSAAT